MLDRHQIEPRAEDRINPIVAFEVSLKIEEHLVRDTASGFRGFVGLLFRNEVVDPFERVQRQVADTDGKRVTRRKRDRDDDRR